MANATTVSSGPGNRATEHIDSTKTFAATDSGVVQNIVTDGLTLTLPASATVGSGYTIVIRNGGATQSSGVGDGAGANGTVGITLLGASGDGITGGGFTAAINKFAINTKATSQVGDEITLVASGANTATAWLIQELKGVWVRTT